MARTSNSLPAFLLALRQSIVAAGVVTDSCCEIATEERFLEYSQGQYCLMLILGDLTPEDQGGGDSLETIFRGKLEFRIISQNLLDVAVSDEIGLTDTNTTKGLFVIFQQLLPVIRFWDQMDAGGNAYLMEGLRLASGLSQARRHPEHEQYLWASLRTEFRICIRTGGSGT